MLNVIEILCVTLSAATVEKMFLSSASKMKLKITNI